MTLEQPSWFFLRSHYENVYRLDVTGPDGTALGLWRVGFDSGSALCWRTHGEIATDELVNDAAEFVWAADWSDAGAASRTSRRLRRRPTYTLSYTTIASPPDGDVWVIPAVANTPGAEGTYFRSDVRILNTYGSRNWADIELGSLPRAIPVS